MKSSSHHIDAYVTTSHRRNIFFTKTSLNFDHPYRRSLQIHAITANDLYNAYCLYWIVTSHRNANLGSFQFSISLDDSRNISQTHDWMSVLCPNIIVVRHEKHSEALPSLKNRMQQQLLH